MRSSEIECAGFVPQLFSDVFGYLLLWESNVALITVALNKPFLLTALIIQLTTRFHMTVTFNLILK